MFAKVSLKLRLVVALSLLFLMLAIGLFWSNINSTRDFLARQLATQSQDTATSLSLRLAMHFQPYDAAAVSNTISALFDAGYYRQITLKDRAGQALFTQSHVVTVEDVPGWFIHSIPLQTPVGLAEVSVGWKILGELAVEIHPGLAYRQLWNTANATLLISLTGWFMASALSYLVVSLALRPIKDLESFARKIAQGEFTRLENPPDVKELRSIGSTLDQMSGSVERMLDEKSRLISTLEAELNSDQVTGLRNRRYLMAALAAAITERLEMPHVLLIGRISDFQEFNQKHGRTAANAVLRKLAVVLQACSQGSFLAKLDGPQFALLAVSADRTAVRAMLDEFVAQASGVLAGHGLRFYAGAVIPSVSASLSSWLSQADQAMKAAESERHSLVFEFPEEAGIPSELLAQGLTESMVDIDLQALQACQGGENVGYEAYARIILGGQRVPVGACLSYLRQQNRLPELDRLVLQKVMGVLASGTVPPSAMISVNLSAESVMNDALYDWLTTLSQKIPGLGNRLCIELPMADVKEASIRARISQLRRSGFGLIIDHFTLDAGFQEILKTLVPDWIKLDSTLVRLLEQPGVSHLLIQSLCEYARGSRILTCASGVETQQLLYAAVEAGFDAVQGTAVGAAQNS